MSPEYRIIEVYESTAIKGYEWQYYVQYRHKFLNLFWIWKTWKELRCNWGDCYSAPKYFDSVSEAEKAYCEERARRENIAKARKQRDGKIIKESSCKL